MPDDAALKSGALAFVVLDADGAGEHIDPGILYQLNHLAESLDAVEGEGMTGPSVVFAGGAQHAMSVDVERSDRARTAPDLCSGPSAQGFGGAKSWVVRLTNSIR